MGFMTAITTCLSKYATFDGRASRPEYWHFILFLMIGAILCQTLDVALSSTDDWSSLSSVFSLVMALPTLAVTARRLHDIDKSGWWQMVALVPVVGWVTFGLWVYGVGTRGANRFGDDPMPMTAWV